MSKKLRTWLLIIVFAIVVAGIVYYLLVYAGVGADSTSVTKAKMVRSWPADNYYQVGTNKRRLTFDFSRNVKGKISKKEISIVKQGYNELNSSSISIRSINFPTAKRMYINTLDDLGAGQIYTISLIPSDVAVEPFSIQFMTAASSDWVSPRILGIRQHSDHISIQAEAGKKTVVLTNSSGEKKMIFDGLSNTDDINLYYYKVGTQATVSGSENIKDKYSARENINYPLDPGVYTIQVSDSNSLGTNTLDGKIIIPDEVQISYYRSSKKIGINAAKNIYGETLANVPITVVVSGTNMATNTQTLKLDANGEVEFPVKLIGKSQKSLRIECYADVNYLLLNSPLENIVSTEDNWSDEVLNDIRPDSLIKGGLAQSEIPNELRSDSLLIGEAIFDLDLF